MPAYLTVPVTETTTPLNGALLARLQSARRGPSASVLLTTTPGPALTSRDIRRLYRLVAQAAGGLNAQYSFEAATGLAADLQRMAAGARRCPTASGLALFTNGSLRAIVALPVPVIDHVAIGDTFATVDLLRAQTHLPRLRLLAVSQRATRLYEGWCHYLVEVEADGFPVLASTMPGRANRSRGLGRDRSQLRMSRTAAHLHQVDAALAARAFHLRLPLIVAGVGRQLAAAGGLPSVSPDLIGTIRGGHYGGNAPRLARLARPVVSRHLQDTRREAIDLLNHAQRRVEGLDAVWSAAVEGTLELLCVEERYTFPDSSRFNGRDRPYPPAADLPIDAVDDAIKLVAGAGGRTVVVDDGSLTQEGGIAALVSCRERRAHIGVERSIPRPLRPRLFERPTDDRRSSVSLTLPR